MEKDKALAEDIRRICHDIVKDVAGTVAKLKVNYYKMTERRLYAYSTLKVNIENYKKDLEDIKVESFERSKDFVTFMSNSGTKMQTDIETLREAKTLEIKRKMHIDECEIKEVDRALDAIANEEYKDIIKLYYFESKPQEEIAKLLHCVETTVWRQRKRLVDKLTIILYGADAVK